MPNRIIRESARTSPTLAQLSHGAERMFWRLTTVADDHGRFEADTHLLLASCFPSMLHKVRARHAESWLGEMVTVELVEVWEIAGRRYGRLINWAKHQRVRAEKSKYPEPYANQHSLTAADICGQRRSDAPESESESESENRESRARARACPQPPADDREPDSPAGKPTTELRGALLTQSVAGSLNGEDDEADAIIARSMKITIAEVRRRRAAIGAQP